MNDTSPTVAAMVREKLLAKSGADRVAMGSQMFDAARKMAIASFPPDLSEIEIKRRLCERLYGNEIDVEAYIAHVVKRRIDETQIQDPSFNCLGPFVDNSWRGF